MSFPPQPPGPQNPGPAGQGGGFGPPQGFGPPEQPGPPQGGYGYPNPAGPPTQPMQPGGYGQPPGGGQYPYGTPPPPPGGGNNGAKVAAIVVAAVLVAGLLVGGVILLSGGDDEDGNKASGSETSSTPTSGESPDAGLDDLPTDVPSAEIPSATPTTEEPGANPTAGLVPFVVLDPGQCFDHPALSSGVDEVETRSCSSPHNGEVISNDKLSGTFKTEKELQDKVMELCKEDAGKRLRKITDGRTYYYYAIYPSLPTYESRGEDTISCSITLSNAKDGTKLTKPLPG